MVWYVMVARVCMVCRAQVLPVDLFGVGLCLPGFRCPGRSRVWRVLFYEEQGTKVYSRL